MAKDLKYYLSQGLEIGVKQGESQWLLIRPYEGAYEVYKISNEVKHVIIDTNHLTTAINTFNKELKNG